MTKYPYITLYPGDWLRDTIAGCSLAAQGLWLRMMFVAHDSNPYGHLACHGRPLSHEAIARMCGAAPEEFRTLLDELDRAGVTKPRIHGNIVSRRMIRDAHLRDVRASAGSRGGHSAQAGFAKAKSKANIKQNTDIENEDEPDKQLIDQLYELYPRKKAKPAALRAIAKALKRADFATIKAGVERYAKTRAGQDPTYTAHPATWFNADRWADEADPVIKMPQSSDPFGEYQFKNPPSVEELKRLG